MSVDHRPEEAPSIARDLGVLAALVVVLGMALYYLRLQADYAVGSGPALPGRLLVVLAVPVFVAAGCLCVRWSAAIANPAIRFVGTAATVYLLVLVALIAFRVLSAAALW